VKNEEVCRNLPLKVPFAHGIPASAEAVDFVPATCPEFATAAPMIHVVPDVLSRTASTLTQDAELAPDQVVQPFTKGRERPQFACLSS
jgi:hypothetical protein